MRATGAGRAGGEGSSIERFITYGVTDEERAAIGSRAVGHGILGLLIEERRPMRIPDIGADPRARFPAAPSADALVPRRPGARPRPGVRQRLPGREADRRRVHRRGRGCARGAGDPGRGRGRYVYAETLRANHELARLELLEERERIAKELHDGVIQALFAVGMGLQGTAAMTRDQEIARRIESATEEVDRTIRDLRVLHLRSPARHPRRPPARSGVAAARTEFQDRTDVLTGRRRRRSPPSSPAAHPMSCNSCERPCRT